MPKIERSKRWSSAIDVLNVVAPPHITHKELVRISRAANLALFKFRPASPEHEHDNRPWQVKDIIEFLASGIRIVVFEDQSYETCSMVFEFIDTDRPTMAFEMREIR